MSRSSVARAVTELVGDVRFTSAGDLVRHRAALRIAARLAAEQEAEQLVLRVDGRIRRQAELGLARPPADAREGCEANISWRLD